METDAAQGSEEQQQAAAQDEAGGTAADAPSRYVLALFYARGQAKRHDMAGVWLGQAGIMDSKQMGAVRLFS